MTRERFIQLHLCLSGFFIPFLLLMPISGALYLLGEKGEQTKSLVYTTSGAIPTEKAERKEYFRKMFLAQSMDFSFEYIRDKGKTLVFRPSNRVHYQAKLLDSGVAEIYRVEPSLQKKLMELHKGHGPKLFKRLETAFGIGLLLIALAGIWLAFSAKDYRRKLMISGGLGTLFFFAALLL